MGGDLGGREGGEGTWVGIMYNSSGGRYQMGGWVNKCDFSVDEVYARVAP